MPVINPTKKHKYLPVGASLVRIEKFVKILTATDESETTESQDPDDLAIQSEDDDAESSSVLETSLSEESDTSEEHEEVPPLFSFNRDVHGPKMARWLAEQGARKPLPEEKGGKSKKAKAQQQVRNLRKVRKQKVVRRTEYETTTDDEDTYYQEKEKPKRAPYQSRKSDEVEKGVKELKAKILAKAKSRKATPEIEGVDLTEAMLSKQEKHYLHLLMDEYKGIFAKDSNDLGVYTDVKHEVDTGEAAPVKQKAYRAPFKVRENQKKQIREMLESGVIKPSSSPWASPVVMVHKKDGSLRFCIDFRLVNRLTKKDAFPLPRTDEQLQQLSGATMYTTMDLQAGYWQIGMAPEDQEKTAFVTEDGLYEWTKMPFGLTNAPATFQRAMQTILQGLTADCCMCFIDDIIVFSTDFWHHLYDLTCVWDRLRENGMKLKGKKCEFARAEVHFLGHIVSKDGIRTDPVKVMKVQNCPEPKNVREVRSFLGLTNYYRKFVLNYSVLASPMYEATKERIKGTKFSSVWNNECREAFDALKKAMVTAPILAYPNFQKPFTLFTDASDYGVGNVLEQEDENGKMRVIAYGGQKFTAAQTHYSMPEKECLAIIRAFKEYRTYFVGNFV